MYPLSVAEGALSAHRREQLVEVGVVYCAKFSRAVDYERDRDAACAEILYEVRGAVDRVDDEELPLRRELLRGAFLAYEMCVGHYLQKPALQPVLHLLVVVRDEVGVPGFRVDMQVAPVGVLDELAAFADKVDYCLYVVFHAFPSYVPVIVYRNRIPYIAVVCIA